MAWQVEVEDIVMHRAACGECRFAGPPRYDRHLAQRDADTHREAHRLEWEAQEAAWEEDPVFPA